MSIFGNLVSKIFGGGEAKAADAAPSAPSPEEKVQAAVDTAATPEEKVKAAVAAADNVDIEELLEGMAAKAGQKLNWRQSIVDLMKLVGLDSSLSARKELADELGYTGDKSDSASMNIWLHKQVMTKLAENGGKVPDDLK